MPIIGVTAETKAAAVSLLLLRFTDYVTSAEVHEREGRGEGGGHAEVTLNMTHDASQQVLQDSLTGITFFLRRKLSVREVGGAERCSGPLLPAWACQL